MGTREFCEYFVEAVGKEAGPWCLAFASSIGLLVPPGCRLWNCRPRSDVRTDARFEIELQCCIP